MKVVVAHDILCPWCWIALDQVRQLQAEFPEVEFDWVGYELFPEELEWPKEGPAKEVDTRKPKTPSRLDLAYAAQGMEKPRGVRPKHMRSHNALQALAYAKEKDVEAEAMSRLYSAYWEEGKAVGEVEVICELLGDILDVEALKEVMASKKFSAHIVPFDDVANERGVFNVPTFFVGEERLAEQTIGVLREKIAANLSK